MEKKLPPQDAVKKTYFGIIQNLDEFFEKFLYCRTTPYNPNRGTITEYPPGFGFISGRGTTIDTWLNWGKSPPKSGNLSAKPVAKVREVMDSRAMERTGGYSFEIIPWKHADHALIVGKDSTMIANTWLGFIPLENLPVINQDNTPIWDGKNHE